MSVKTTINSSQGVVTVNNAEGVILEQNPNNTGFAPYAMSISRVITSNSTLTAADAGLLTISGSTATALTASMDPTNCIGAEFTFRNLSTHFHLLSGSGNVFANNTSVGAQLALSNSVGSSVVLKSDGVAFIVLGNRGAVTIT
jgi:hypothetical protein